jgi:hypothetical protein
MKHLRKFKESAEVVTFKNTDEDIQLFFTDYTDEDTNALTIKNGLVIKNGNDARFIDDTTYMRDSSKYRRAKLITLRVGKPNGIQLKTGKCMSDLEMLSNTLLDIQRFYDLSGEDINYTINTDYMGLTVQFITLGDMVKSEESKFSKIDEYLKRIGECIKKKGHKKQTIDGNFLDMRFAKKGGGPLGFDYAISSKLRKIGLGELTFDMTADVIDREIITVRNEAWEDGLKFDISGGDNQVVLKLVKR